MISPWLGQAQTCARDGIPFPVHGLSNPQIAEMLHALAHGKEQGAVRMLFGDGSQSAPFPLGCLRPPTGTQPLWREGKRRLLQVGLLSRRHPLMDFAVDMYLLRNAETKGESYAGIEEQACLAARELLDEAARAADADGVLLELYQTGLEPAVVGFWRGVCEMLREHPDRPMLARPRSKTPSVVADVAEDLGAESEKLCAAYPDFFRLDGEGAERVGAHASAPTGSPPEDEELAVRTVWGAPEIDALDVPVEFNDPGEDGSANGKGPTRLRWLSERPMRQDESDATVNAFPLLVRQVSRLFEVSQYSCGLEWGR